MTNKKLIQLLNRIGLTGCQEYHRLGIITARELLRVKNLWYRLNMAESANLN